MFMSKASPAAVICQKNKPKNLRVGGLVQVSQCVLVNLGGCK